MRIDGRWAYECLKNAASVERRRQRISETALATRVAQIDVEARSTWGLRTPNSSCRSQRIGRSEVRIRRGDSIRRLWESWPVRSPPAHQRGVRLGGDRSTRSKVAEKHERTGNRDFLATQRILSREKEQAPLRQPKFTRRRAAKCGMRRIRKPQEIKREYTPAEAVAADAPKFANTQELLIAKSPRRTPQMGAERRKVPSAFRRAGPPSPPPPPPPRTPPPLSIAPPTPIHHHH